MSTRAKMSIVCSLLLVIGACRGAEQQTEQATAAGDVAMAQLYPNAPAGVILENDFAIVQRLAATPGKWVGEHSHAGNQLAIIITPGTVTYREDGRETDVTREAGEAFWVEKVASHDHAPKGAPTDAVLITMKHKPGGMGMGQTYPNIRQETVIDNEYAIVQRAVAAPGQWAGEHSHPGGQLGVVVKGGTFTYREGGQERQVNFEAGQVIDVEAATHDHANTGKTPMEFLTITPKR